MIDLDIIGQHGAAWYARWLAWSAWQEVRGTWDDIPGPLPVRIIIAVVLVMLFAVAVAVPGQADEILLAWLVGQLRLISRRRRARSAA